jgi:hypothetical protein
MLPSHSQFEGPRDMRLETPPEILALHLPPCEWEIIVDARPNLLVEGPSSTTEGLIQVLASVSPEPWRDWRQAPPDAPLSTTLVVRDADALTPEEQRLLLDRLNGVGGQPPRQIVSTSARPVFPLVERGVFLADLYYRMNSVRLPISEY